MRQSFMVLAVVACFLLGSVSFGRAEQDLKKRVESLEEELKTLKDLMKKKEEAERKQEAESTRKTQTLGEELESLKLKLTLPETKELKSKYGLGPAASKVYGVERGLSIGAYGEGSYKNFISDNGTAKRKDTIDATRLVAYLGYKFNEWILVNSEIEFEHATTESTVSAGEGEVSVEFIALDLLFFDFLNVRGGLVLIPVGFLNEIHEPPFYFGNNRPEVERQIIPSTWREAGVGIFGMPLPGLEYRIYVVNGLNAKGLSKSNIRDARQLGNRAIFEDPALTMRVDYSPSFVPGLTVGSSFLWGDSGQDQMFAGRNVDVNILLYEFHAQYKYRGLHVRGLIVRAHIGDAAVLSLDPAISGPISSKIWGAYIEIAYNILPILLPGTTHSLEPFYRFERFNTQGDVPAGFIADLTKDVTVNTFGLSYKPIPNVVIKADLRFFDSNGGELPDEFNLGVGFAF